MLIGVPALIAAGAAFQPFVPARLLYLDPMVAAQRVSECCSLYLGAMSTFGVLIWIAGAAVCLFAAFVMSKRQAPQAVLACAVAGGMITAWLGFDDAFLFHERIAPKAGLPEPTMVVLYGVAVLAYLFRCFDVLRRGDLFLLGSALVCFALSAGFDFFVKGERPLLNSIEDGTKFVGIFVWTAYHAGLMSRLLTDSTAELAHRAR